MAPGAASGVVDRTVDGAVTALVLVLVAVWLTGVVLPGGEAGLRRAGVLVVAVLAVVAVRGWCGWLSRLDLGLTTASALAVLAVPWFDAPDLPPSVRGTLVVVPVGLAAVLVPVPVVVAILAGLVVAYLPSETSIGDVHTVGTLWVMVAVAVGGSVVVPLLRRAASVADGCAPPHLMRRACREAVDAVAGHPPVERPTSVDLAGAPTALAAGALTPVEVHVAAGALVPAGVADAVGGAVAEALRNVDRHARASRAVLRARRVGDGVEVVLDDDGVGLGAARPGERSFGLTGWVVGRMAEVGGLAHVGPGPLGGTRVALRWHARPGTAAVPARHEAIALAVGGALLLPPQSANAWAAASLEGISLPMALLAVARSARGSLVVTGATALGVVALMVAGGLDAAAPAQVGALLLCPLYGPVAAGAAATLLTRLGRSVASDRTEQRALAEERAAAESRTALRGRAAAAVLDSVVPVLAAVAEGPTQPVGPTLRERASALGGAVRDEMLLPGVLDARTHATLRAARTTRCSVELRCDAEASGLPGWIAAVLCAALGEPAPQQMTLAVDRGGDGTKVSLVVVPGEERRRERVLLALDGLAPVVDLTDDVLVVGVQG